MTFWDTVESGEYVMIALAVILITIITIWWVRGVKLKRARLKKLTLVTDKVRDCISEGDIDNAIGTCLATHTATGHVMATGLTKVGRPMMEIRDSMQQESALKLAELDKGSVWLRYLAAISPLLGLGGTLAGVCHRVYEIVDKEMPVEPIIIAEAVNPTIVTTIAGIGVGIIALVGAGCLESGLAKIKLDMARGAESVGKLLSQPSH